jgi:hypothetical protein
MLHAAACPDCDSDVTVIEDAPHVYRAEVRHDDSCPWFTQFKRDGGLDIRYNPRAAP